MTVTHRGTSNSGKNGSAEGRRRRRAWLLKTYRADVDVLVFHKSEGDAEELLNRHLTELLKTFRAEDVRYAGELRTALTDPEVWTVPQGHGEAACRCYRCGRLLWFCTLEVDRIHPGWKKSTKYPRGGTYVRENIRPACGKCNKITGNEDRWSSHKPFRLLAELLDLIRGDHA